uniref:Uncharacterized protein n=1 Tax=Meloidogyne enterolobii TaxID=390850 RepID=A0A6V7U441_MELEN|nr:unnamed protein product [Meloidogyne enterolobii]
MSKIWNYFTLSGRIAFCKECDYKKDFPPRAPTTTLAQSNPDHTLHFEIGFSRSVLGENV